MKNETDFINSKLQSENCLTVPLSRMISNRRFTSLLWSLMNVGKTLFAYINTENFSRRGHESCEKSLKMSWEFMDQIVTAKIRILCWEFSMNFNVE